MAKCKNPQQRESVCKSLNGWLNSQAAAVKSMACQCAFTACPSNTGRPERQEDGSAHQPIYGRDVHLSA